MVRYLLSIIVNIPFMLLCYIVNPVVVLFSNEEGNLPSYLSWFQTQDHSLDLEPDFIAEKWPLLVDKPEYPEWKRKLLRYLRRVTWLYRNTGYGFAYDVLGYDVIASNLVMTKGSNINTSNIKHAQSGYVILYDKTKPLWNRGWCVYTAFQYGNSSICFQVFLGWKMNGLYKRQENDKAMLAMRINPFMTFEKD